MANFGEYILHIIQDVENGKFIIHPEDVAKGVEMGIEIFDAARLDIMKARAAAYGHVLQVEQAAPAQKG